MIIIGRANESGLGLTSWWSSGSTEEEDEGNTATTTEEQIAGQSSEQLEASL